MLKSFVNSMRGLFTIAACSLLMNAPAYAQDRTADVAAIKQQVVAAGIDLEHGPGECGRFEVTKRFAWKFRAEGFGLIAKFGSQNGCSATNTLDEPKYAVDAVLLSDGRCFDLLGGGNEGPNTPHWISCTSDASLYRTAFDPGDAPPPPADITLRVEALEQRVNVLTQNLQTLAEQLQVVDDTLLRMNQDINTQLDEHAAALKKLLARPVPVECRAAVLGINISCKLLTIINP